jgi:hypothetical protein
VIVVGSVLAAWGAIVLWFARPVDAGWRGLLDSLRPGAGQEARPGTPIAAFTRGMVWMRRAGLAGLVVGLVVSAIGAVLFAVESL